MTIKKIITNDHPEDTGYAISIETDSSIEYDIVLRHLTQATEEYKNWIRKFTKVQKENNNE